MKRMPLSKTRTQPFQTNSREVEAAPTASGIRRSRTFQTNSREVEASYNTGLCCSGAVSDELS